MSDKLTPRQNELISEALCFIAIEQASSDRAPEVLKKIRRALISELEAVTSETSLEYRPTTPSISG